MRIPLLYVLSLTFVVNWAASATAQDFEVFVTDATNKKITRLAVATGGTEIVIESRDSVSLPFAPHGLTAARSGKQLIATSSGQAAGQAAAIGVSGDKLEVIAVTSLPHPAGYTSLDRDDKYFLTCNYKQGIVAVYAIKPDGSVGALVASKTTPQGQAHCVLPTRDNRFVYIPCVKTDNAIFQYQFDADSGQLTPMQPLDASPPAMFGPRHLVYHPRLPIVYFSNEQQLGVSVYQIQKNGQLVDRQHAVTMARRSPHVRGQRDMHASDLVITPDGKRLFVAVRDFVGDQDSVFTFDVLDDGRLSLVARSKAGDIPWAIALSPDARVLVVSQTGDRRLTAYRIQDDGSLTAPVDFALESSVRTLVVQ